MIKRLSIYIREMFPIGIYVPFAFVNHYVLFFTIQLFLGALKPIISWYSLIGVATIVGFMFMMRVFDEMKDEAVDARLFPERPYPRGAVLKNDLWTALWVVFCLVVLLNSYRSYTLPYFLASVVYGWLTYKWFFAKKYIQSYLFIALVTHQPISVLLNIYVISTAMVQVGIFHWSSLILWSSFFFYLPVLAWELARKIKAEGNENDYITYSKLIGSRTAAALVLLVILVFFAALTYYGYRLHLPLGFFVGMGILGLLELSLFLRFIYRPTQKNLLLKKAAEIGCTSASLLYLLFIIIHWGIEWR